MTNTLFIRPAGERPEYWRVPAFLWGRGVSFDSDGNSENPDDRYWTGLTVRLRPSYAQRVDVDPIVEDDSVLVVRATTAELAARAAWYIAVESGGAVADASTGPFTDPASIEGAMGDFDAVAALQRARAED